MSTSKIGIVVCSRTDSKRLPGKPFLKVKGKFLIAHLLDRLVSTGIPVYLAVPTDELEIYQQKLVNYIDGKSVFVFAGERGDPLKRTYAVALAHGLDHVIRVTHDKIFLSYKQIDHFVATYLEGGFDYLYSTNFIPGMGFEIFSKRCLADAHQKFLNVEHISYAVESVAQSVCNLMHFPFSRTWLNRKKPNSGLRLLIDYPDDLENISQLMARLGSDADITKIVDGIENEPQANSLPEVTVYTCSYEDVEFLDRAIQSVLGQSFASFEYLLIDDGSQTSAVHKAMAKYKRDKRVHVVRNQANRGLASSSNVAAAMARGRYVIRLDADDYLVDEKVLDRMVRRMEESNADILYPHNYKEGRIQEGCEQHHVGGTMFKKRTLDYLRFTDGLRHYEGLDLYHRAMLAGRRIEYFHEPTFYYRQRAESMSRAPSPERLAVAAKIKIGLLGDELLEDAG
jgi:spore coat polysaccharide biosynthesis protein SpsF (cytidylyltransferase family)